MDLTTPEPLLDCTADCNAICLAEVVPGAADEELAASAAVSDLLDACMSVVEALFLS